MSKKRKDPKASLEVEEQNSGTHPEEARDAQPEETEAVRSEATEAVPSGETAPAEKGGRRAKKAKKKRLSRRAKAIIILCSAMVLLIGVYAVCSAFFKDAERNVVDLGYGSVSTEVEEGEVYSLAKESEYTPIDVFGRLNWKFAQQNNWCAEMHGIVDTVINQDVQTYKEYDNGILISADLTKSSLISGASQFCYLKNQDRVLWRKPVGGSSTYNGMDTEWQTGEPYRTMTIGGENGFKAVNGLPAYELSVYVIEPNTVMSASRVQETAPGVFSITYELNPNTWVNKQGITEGATCYYSNQMIFTGGLKEPPIFDKISVTFRFNENWEVLETNIHEEYRAVYGIIKAPCTSDSTTTYRYNVPEVAEKVRAVYQGYFAQYVDAPVDDVPKEHTLTALDCLAEAFGGILTEPTVLNAGLTVDGTPVDGVIDLDLSKANFVNFDLAAISAKIKAGAVRLWVENGNVYLSYGGLKLRGSIKDALNLLGALPVEAAETAALDVGAVDPQDLLSALAGGEFTVSADRTAAELHSTLPLLGLSLKLDIYFTLGEAVGFDHAVVALDLDGTEISAQVSYGEEPLPALTEQEKGDYADAVSKIPPLLSLFSSDVLHADLNYQNAEEGISLTGGVDLETATLTLQGALMLTVDRPGVKLSKTVSLGYRDGTVYLDLDGVKIAATVDEVGALVGSYLAQPAAETPAVQVGDLVEKLLSEDFAGLFRSSQSGSAFELAAKGTELLQAFGEQFALGDVSLTLDGENVTLRALGANAAITRGSAFTLETTGYTSVVRYVPQLLGLVTSEYLHAQLSYTLGDLVIAGDADVATGTLTARAALTLNYGSVQKALNAVYENGVVYLTLDGVKLQLDAAAAAGLLERLTGGAPAPAPAALPETDGLLDGLLGLNFGQVLSLEERDGVLHITVDSAPVLQVLGISAALGELDIAVSDKVVITGTGLSCTLTQGDVFETQTSGFTDLTPVLGTVEEILLGGGVSLVGDIALTVGGTQVAVEITDGGISYKNGIEVCLTALIGVNGNPHTVNFSYGAETLRLAYGNLGAELSLDELPVLEAAFETLYGRIRGVVVNLYPEMPTYEELMGLLQNGQTALMAAEETSDILGDIDIEALLASLTITPSSRQNGLFAVTAGGLTLDFIHDERGLGALVGFTNDALTAEGTVYLSGLKELPAMPEISYLSAEDFAELMDYLGASAELAGEQDLTFTLSGTVTSAEDTYAPFMGVKYDIGATLGFYAGETFPIHLDVEGKSLYVNSDLYLHAKIEAAASLDTDTSFDVDLFLLDAAPAADGEAVKDGVLDVYLSVSTFKPGEEGREPLNVYAPADEIMRLLSAVCAVTGLDTGFLDEYVVSYWLEKEAAVQGRPVREQLHALGGALMPLIGGLTGGVPASGAEVLAAPAAEERRGYIKSITVGESELVLTLDPLAVYGNDALEDLTVTVGKTAESGKSLISSVELENVYDPTGTEKYDFALQIAPQPAEQTQPANTYNSFLGAEEFLYALAASATNAAEDVISGEEEQHTYAVNRYFYLDGTVSATLFSIVTVSIDIVAVSVTIDENGELAVNIRLEYQGVRLLVVAINGDSTVDITIKGGMVYMKRVQTTYYGALTENRYETPVTLYRVCTLENFMGDMLTHLGFILNFGEMILNQLPASAAATPAAAAETPEEPAEPAPRKDIGTQLTETLKAYTYTANADGRQWDLALDGTAVSNGIVGELNATLKADAEGYLRDLVIGKCTLSLPVSETFSLPLEITADLRWRNAGGAFEEGASDKTVSCVGEILDNKTGMGAMLAAEDWSEYRFLEGQPAEIGFYYTPAAGGDRVEIAKQSVMLSTGVTGQVEQADGSKTSVPLTYAENTLLSADIVRPGLASCAGYGTEFTYAWDSETEYRTGEVMTERTILATQQVLYYDITFLSAYNFGEEWTHVNEMYTRTLKMRYNTPIVFVGTDVEYTVSESTQIELPALPEGAESWLIDAFGETGVTFRAFFPLKITYKSAIPFTADGAEHEAGDYTVSVSDSSYTLIQPTAAGHTFLGWFTQTESGWAEVTTPSGTDLTLEALWASDLSVTLDGSRSGILNYNYTFTSTLAGGELLGAFADEAVISVTYQYGGSNAFNARYDFGRTSHDGYENDSYSTSSRDRASTLNVTVTVTYSYGAADFEKSFTATASKSV